MQGFDFDYVAICLQFTVKYHFTWSSTNRWQHGAPLGQKRPHTDKIWLFYNQFPAKMSAKFQRLWRCLPSPTIRWERWQNRVTKSDKKKSKEVAAFKLEIRDSQLVHKTEIKIQRLHLCFRFSFGLIENVAMMLPHDRVGNCIAKTASVKPEIHIIQHV